MAIVVRSALSRRSTPKISVSKIARTILTLIFLLSVTIMYKFYFSIVGNDLTCTANDQFSSYEQIQQCFSERVAQHSSPVCTTIESWSDIQRCISGYRGRSSATITTIHVVGERHCGTKFLTRELQKCFHNIDVAANEQHEPYRIKVHRDFIRSKHFFQPLYGNDYLNSLVVAIVRDPVQWAYAMYKIPYHSPNHIAGHDLSGPKNSSRVIPLPNWRDFINKPWTLPTRGQLDASIRKDPIEFHEALYNHACNLGFNWNEVVPCRVDLNASISEDASTGQFDLPADIIRGMHPIYELPRPRAYSRFNSNINIEPQPYDSILALRRDKMLHFLLELPLIVNIGGYIAVRYEDLLQYGTQFILNKISQMVGVKHMQCKAASPQPERMSTRKIPSDFREYVLQHMDSSAEKLADYPYNFVHS